VELLDLGLDLGDELDRRGARADRGDALAAQVVVVVPARRVEDLALEVGEAGDVGQLRLDQPADRGQEEVAVQRPRARLEPPGARVLVPARVGELGVEADPLLHPAFGGRAP
jgi:hypothetical protein